MSFKIPPTFVVVHTWGFYNSEYGKFSSIANNSFYLFDGITLNYKMHFEDFTVKQKDNLNFWQVGYEILETSFQILELFLSRFMFAKMST